MKFVQLKITENKSQTLPLFVSKRESPTQASFHPSPPTSPFHSARAPVFTLHDTPFDHASNAVRETSFHALSKNSPTTKTVINLLFYSLIPLGSLLTSCTSTSNPPVIVQVTESTPTGGRFLSPERQRDVWLAPQALDGEMLQHEQYVTFIEKPASWKTSSIVEPHSTPSPQLPLENSRYDAEALRRAREIARTTQAKVDQLSNELESLKSESSKGLQAKDEQIQRTEETLQMVRSRLETSEKRLASMEGTEKLKTEQMTAKQKSKSWWKLW